MGARLRGRTARQRSKKGSEKVLGRVLGKASQKGAFKKVAFFRGFYCKKGFCKKGLSPENPNLLAVFPKRQSHLEFSLCFFP